MDDKTVEQVEHHHHHHHRCFTSIFSISRLRRYQNFSSIYQEEDVAEHAQVDQQHRVPASLPFWF